jgi:hypothetical protein
VDDERDRLLKEKLDLMNPERVKRDNFLDVINQIESSGGSNFNHPEVDFGIQKGDSGIGNFGLMPNTVREILKRQAMAGRQPAALPDDSAQMKAELESNPELERQLADELARKVLRANPDPEMAAYAWNQGHNLKSDKIKERDYQEHPYVQKFKKIRSKLGAKK